MYLSPAPLYQAGIQQAALLHPPRHGLCCKVGHDCKRGGGDKRERGSEDCATAQALQILPHLHLRLHSPYSHPLFPNKKQIQAIGCQSVKLILIQHLSFFDRMKESSRR